MKTVLASQNLRVAPCSSHVHLQGQSRHQCSLIIHKPWGTTPQAKWALGGCWAPSVQLELGSQGLLRSPPPSFWVLPCWACSHPARKTGCCRWEIEVIRARPGEAALQLPSLHWVVWVQVSQALFVWGSSYTHFLIVLLLRGEGSRPTCSLLLNSTGRRAGGGLGLATPQG